MVGDVVLSQLYVKESVKDLKKGKGAGVGTLSSEYYTYTSDNQCVLLSHLCLTV